MKVSEVFYAPQGEGLRQGEASVFVRLSGCSAKHACYESGVRCDTEFESGEEMTETGLEVRMDAAILHAMGERFPDNPVPGTWIVWTGGEPLDQLTVDIVDYFRSRGYRNALETSGVRLLDSELADCFDHITVSPKVAEHVLQKHFGHLSLIRKDASLSEFNVDELRYVRHAGQPGPPEPVLRARSYYLSPHSDGLTVNQTNVNHVVGLVLRYPRWRLSVQMHKLTRTL